VEAEVLLMDEWIAVGDAGFRAQAQERLTSMLERAHILVIASHEPSLVRSICNKVLRMDHGQASEVVDIVDMDELMARPAPGSTL